jgi:hypothetical protein
LCGVDNQANSLILRQIEVRLGFQDFLHVGRIERFIALNADGPHGGAFGHVQLANLHCRGVRRHRHCTTERIDFGNDLRFSSTADGRIAWHIADPVKVG